MKSLNLIEFNDRARRSRTALSTGSVRQVLDRSLQFLNLASYVRPEYEAKESVNQSVFTEIVNWLPNLTEAILEHDGTVEEVILPLSNRSPIGKYITHNVLKAFNESSAIKYKLQTRKYTLDLSTEGHIIQDIKNNIFDENHIGFMSIDDNIKTKWRLDTPQLEMEF